MSDEFQARIAALWVFPIKSCAGVPLLQAALTPTGLAWDRAWMVVDAQGEMLTQRELPRMALIQPELLGPDGVSAGPTPLLAESGETPYTHLQASALVLTAPHMTALKLPIALTAFAKPLTVRVWDDRVSAFDMGEAASAWLTGFLGANFGPLRLVRFDPNHARASDAQWTQGLATLNQFSDGFPVLVASTASLEDLNTRLQARGEAAVDMRRFRANLVLGPALADTKANTLEPAGPDLNPHDEDRIGTLTIHTSDQTSDHRAVPVQLHPAKPCARCPIPNLDPDTALSHPAVSDTLQTYRQDARLKGALTFGMSCIPLAGVGQVLRVGQGVSADWNF